MTVYRDPDNKRLDPTTSSHGSNSLSLILEPIIISGVPALISDLEKPRPIDKGIFETSR